MTRTNRFLPASLFAALAITGMIISGEAAAEGASKTERKGVDLKKIDRTIVKEPVYRSKTPKYCLVVFGPEARVRMWLVTDGDRLYVDRNANGDLTDDAGPYLSRTKASEAGSWRVGKLFKLGLDT